MGMSGTYGTADEAESIATIHAALERGVNLIDTGDFYAMGKNELLVGKALRGRPPRRGPAQREVRRPARPRRRVPRLRRAAGGDQELPRATACRASASITSTSTARRASTPPSRSRTPIGAIADMVKAGYVRYIGLSEVGAETIRRAAAVHPICDLQIEYSLLSRGPEATILPTCRELGIATTAYGVLSRGLISGRYRADQGIRPATSAARMPRFQGDNLTHNLALVDELRGVADADGGHRRPARVRLGAVPGRGHRAAGRRPPARPAARGARRPRRPPRPRTISIGSSARFLPTRRPAIATERRRWPTLTASAAALAALGQYVHHQREPADVEGQRRRPDPLPAAALVEGDRVEVVVGTSRARRRSCSLAWSSAAVINEVPTPRPRASSSDEEAGDDRDPIRRHGQRFEP